MVTLWVYYQKRKEIRKYYVGVFNTKEIALKTKLLLKVTLYYKGTSYYKMKSLTTPKTKDGNLFGVELQNPKTKNTIYSQISSLK